MKTLIVKAQPDEHLVLETLRGEYAGTISQAGYHLVPPWRKVAQRLTKHPVQAMAAFNAASLDQNKLTVSTFVTYTIADPAKYVRAAAQPHSAVVQQLNDTAREIVSGIPVAEVWQRRADITARAAALARQQLADSLGVDLNGFDIQEINRSSGVLSAPDEKLKNILAEAAAAPDKVAQAMGEGLQNGIAVRKPITLRRP